MIRAPGPLIYLWYLKGGRLLETGRLFLCWETAKCAKKSFDIYFKKSDYRNRKSTKYTVNIHLMAGNFENHWSIQR